MNLIFQAADSLQTFLRDQLIRQFTKLDWPYILGELKALSELAEKPDAPKELERLRRAIEKK